MPIDLKRGAKAGVEHSWELSWRMWAKIGAEYASAGDFFLKTDAQTFVAVENLRSLLRYYDSSAQHYLGQNNFFVYRHFMTEYFTNIIELIIHYIIGHTLMSRWRTDNVKYNSATGYVLSRGSVTALTSLLRRIQPGGPSNSKRECVDHDGADEDVSLSICLRAVGVLPGNTLDSRGRQRFMLRPAAEELNLFRNAEDWYWSHKPADVGEGANCCSKFPILFGGHKGKLFQVFFSCMCKTQYFTILKI